MRDPVPIHLSPDMTIGGQRRRIARLLADAGFDAPQREARLLLEIATALGAEDVILQEARVLTSSEALRLRSALDRRLAHEPVSRIRGSREFYGREFLVTPDVLDPRPETELLVEVALDYVDGHGGRSRPWRVADIGTGSGCLLVTLLAELPNAVGIGTDVSNPALEVARVNAQRSGVAARARFVAGSLTGPLDGPIDILVSNPPYIAAQDIRDLPASVRNFDPWLALDGGPDGLEIYRQLIPSLAHVLPQGLGALEVGAGQAEDVGEVVLSRLGPAVKRLRRVADLGGQLRCVAVETQY